MIGHNTIIIIIRFNGLIHHLIIMSLTLCVQIFVAIQSMMNQKQKLQGQSARKIEDILDY